MKHVGEVVDRDVLGDLGERGLSGGVYQRVFKYMLWTNRETG